MRLSKIIANLKNKENINYNKYLRSIGSLNELEIIKHSYDLQAGSYIKKTSKNKFKIDKMCDEIANLINKNFSKSKSFLDCGCGEMTVSSRIIKRLSSIKKFFLFDISLNRMVVGKTFAKKTLNRINFKKLTLFCSSLDAIPLNDNSIDLVFTNHAIEPNKDNAAGIIKELYRVANNGLILNEPDFTTASKDQKKRMIKHNYVRNIPKILKKLKINFKKKKLKYSVSNHNPTTSFIILKKQSKKNKSIFVDPFYKKKIIKKKYYYFSQKLSQIYFIFKDIPIFDFTKPTVINNSSVKD